MAKNFLQDIVPHKIAKKIPVRETVRSIQIPEEKTSYDFEPVKKPARNKNESNKHTIWFVAIIAVVFLIFAISLLFSKAHITVTPKEKDFSLNDSFTADKDSTGDGISFDSVVLSGEENKTVSANGTKITNTKATGRVVIYNTFSTDPQKLLIDTRLEGTNGKIYKTDTKVTVPGIQAGGIPGSVEVGIYAVEAGVEYNSAPLDFKIFGFKGTPKYTKIYGRSKGEINGGFKGQVPQISEVDKAKAVQELTMSLHDKLFKKAADQIPEGFVLLKDAVFLDVSPDSISSTMKENTSASISVKGTLYGFIFNEKNITDAIMKKLIADYDGSDVYISNIKDLNFSMPSPADSVNDNTRSLADITKINFTLKGNAKVVWKVDTKKLLTDLVNSSKKDFSSILSKYSNIASADLVLRPVWKNTFPEKTKDINITVNYPK